MANPWWTVRIGIVLGACFGIANVISTYSDPLADDSLRALAFFYGPMLAGFAVAGGVAYRRSGKIVEGVTSGALVGAITLAVFQVASLIRVNLFLEALSHRADWQDLMFEFQRRGAGDLRAYVNESYLKQTVPKLCAGAVLGAVFGTVGGLFSRRVAGPVDGRQRQD